MSKFDSAKYYSVYDDETLSHESPEEAITDAYEDCSVADLADEMLGLVPELPVEVTAWNPKSPPTDDRLTQLAESIVGDIEEWWCDEDGWGNPDDSHLTNPKTGWPEKDGDGRRAVERLVVALREITQGLRIWQCEVVGTREYSKAEAIAIIKGDRPDE